MDRGVDTHTCSDLRLLCWSGHFHSHQLGKNLSVALCGDLGDVLYLSVLEEKATGGKAGQHSHDMNQYKFIHFTLHYKCTLIQLSLIIPSADDFRPASLLNNLHQQEPACVRADGRELTLISCGCDCQGRSEIHSGSCPLVS